VAASIGGTAICCIRKEMTWSVWRKSRTAPLVFRVAVAEVL
jgi:hypothetical protein